MPSKSLRKTVDKLPVGPMCDTCGRYHTLSGSWQVASLGEFWSPLFTLETQRIILVMVGFGESS